MAVGGGAVMGMAEEVDRNAQAEAATVAAQGAETAGALGDDCASEALRFDGPTWRGLIDASTDRRARAIVVGARGLTGIASTLGSVSSAITHHSPRPVLVVPPAGQPTISDATTR